MKHPILVRPNPPNQYQAHAVWFPHLTAVAASEEEAVEQVRQSLVKWLNSGRLVSVEVLEGELTNSLLELAGDGKNDPDFDVYLEEIQRFRQEVEAKECSNTSSTPTT